MGKTSEAAKRATNRYRKENTLQVNVEFNKRTDPELYEAMENYKGSRPAVLREALRRCMDLITKP